MIENTIFNYLCYVVQTFKKTKKKRNILPTQKKINVTVVSGGIQKKKFWWQIIQHLEMIDHFLFTLFDRDALIMQRLWKAFDLP